MVYKAAPGYYRVMLGDFEVTAISDGTFKMPADKLLQGIEPAAIDKALAAQFESLPVVTSINAFLVNTGSKLVLIDTGAGDFFAPTTGKMLVNLEASGYRPDQVDDILITHMHPDHVGGLLSKAHMTFPNATLWVNSKDAKYWLDPARLAEAPKGKQGMFRDAMAAIKPYKAAGHFKTFSGGKVFMPGIRALPELGHTPGHTGYLVTSKDRTMLVWGDIIHVQAVQFPNPSVTIAYDSNPGEARDTRMKVLKKAVAGKYLIAGAHLAFPGLGHVRKAGHGYTWIPVNYGAPQ
jgi:glyoxylase-like metal-dependent hydrolase (beta-lactamase superfamily II)